MATEESVRTPGKFSGALLRNTPAKVSAPVEPAQETEPVVEEEASRRCYTFLNVGQRPALMLEFQGARGERTAFGYPYLVSVALPDPSKMELLFTACKVTVLGRALGPIFAKVLLHRVTRIQALGERYSMGIPDGETVVERIEFAGG